MPRRSLASSRSKSPQRNFAAYSKTAISSPLPQCCRAGFHHRRDVHNDLFISAVNLVQNAGQFLSPFLPPFSEKIEPSPPGLPRAGIQPVEILVDPTAACSQFHDMGAQLL